LCITRQARSAHSLEGLVISYDFEEGKGRRRKIIGNGVEVIEFFDPFEKKEGVSRSSWLERKRNPLASIIGRGREKGEKEEGPVTFHC